MASLVSIFLCVPRYIVTLVSLWTLVIFLNLKSLEHLEFYFAVRVGDRKPALLIPFMK